jgi:branched-subunit amino acid aminotransferase/4-amino-4-deoxychorismate lyase
MLNWKGYVAEGTISNIFAMKKQVLFTPSLDTGILDGITRDLVLHLAKQNKITVKEKLLRPRELAKADECFITNTTVEIMPVTSINGTAVGSGTPGPVTRKLLEAYRNEVQRHV